MHLNYSYIVTLRRKGKIMKFEIKSRILENAYKLIKSIACAVMPNAVNLR